MTGAIDASYMLILHFILTLDHISNLDDYPPSRHEIVELFLQLSSDPKAQYYSASRAWGRFWSRLDRFETSGYGCQTRRDEHVELRRNYKLILSLLIKHTALADGNVGVFLNGSGDTISTENVPIRAKGNFLSREEINRLFQELRYYNALPTGLNNRQHERRREERRERISNDYSRHRNRR